MAAISAFEELRNDGGPLPPEIFSDEPGGNHPIPDQVDYHDGLGVDRTFLQTLDDQRRLVSVHLAGADEPYMTRTWAGAGYLDRYADGRTHTVLPSPVGGFVIEDSDGTIAEVWADVDQTEKDYTYLHAEHSRHSHGLYLPTTYLAKVDPGGGIRHETETPTVTKASAGEFEFEPEPIAFSEWEYNEAGVLSSITRYLCRHYPDGVRRANYIERFIRTGDTLRIVGTYQDSLPPGIVGRKQIRTYDSEGRVAHITHRIEFPDTAIRIAEISMRYAA